MFEKMTVKLKMFLTDERTTGEKIESCKDAISNYRWLSIAFAISFLYTSTCYFIFPTYIPEWFPFLESTWFELRNAWGIHLFLMLLNACLWLSEVIKKNKLLKRLA